MILWQLEKVDGLGTNGHLEFGRVVVGGRNLIEVIKSKYLEFVCCKTKSMMKRRFPCVNYFDGIMVGKIAVWKSWDEGEALWFKISGQYMLGAGCVAHLRLKSQYRYVNIRLA